jgi:hypothetical protein
LGTAGRYGSPGSELNPLIEQVINEEMHVLDTLDDQSAAWRRAARNAAGT